MIHSSHRNHKAKAIAAVLAMIADSQFETPPRQARSTAESDEWLRETAAEFCAALERYAERVTQSRRERRKFV